MAGSWIMLLLDAFLPRHTRAERALAVSPKVLSELITPVTLPKKSWAHALFPYRDERVRAIIQAVKYYGERQVVETVAPFVADYITELIDQKQRFEGWERVTLVPIPSSTKRYRERGYNQAALFAKRISELVVDATYDETLLMREERTSQVHVPRAERKNNMRDAFTAHSRAHNRFFILIDDVVESGATLEDARRALMDVGARGVIAVAIAH